MGSGARIGVVAAGTGMIVGLMIVGLTGLIRAPDGQSVGVAGYQPGGQATLDCKEGDGEGCTWLMWDQPDGAERGSVRLCWPLGVDDGSEVWTPETDLVLSRGGRTGCHWTIHRAGGGLE